MDNVPFYITALIVVLCLLIMIIHYEFKNRRSVIFYTKKYTKKIEEMSVQELLSHLLKRIEKLENHCKIDEDNK